LAQVAWLIERDCTDLLASANTQRPHRAMGAAESRTAQHTADSSSQEPYRFLEATCTFFTEQDEDDEEEVQRRTSRPSQTWRAWAFRTSGPDGYRFGDITMHLVHKAAGSRMYIVRVPCTDVEVNMCACLDSSRNAARERLDFSPFESGAGITRDRTQSFKKLRRERHGGMAEMLRSPRRVEFARLMLDTASRSNEGTIQSAQRALVKMLIDVEFTDEADLQRLTESICLQLKISTAVPDLLTRVAEKASDQSMSTQIKILSGEVVSHLMSRDRWTILMEKGVGNIQIEEFQDFQQAKRFFSQLGCSRVLRNKYGEEVDTGWGGNPLALQTLKNTTPLKVFLQAARGSGVCQVCRESLPDDEPVPIKEIQKSGKFEVRCCEECRAFSRTLRWRCLELSECQLATARLLSSLQAARRDLQQNLSEVAEHIRTLDAPVAEDDQKEFERTFKWSCQKVMKLQGRVRSINADLEKLRLSLSDKQSLNSRVLADMQQHCNVILSESHTEMGQVRKRTFEVAHLSDFHSA